MGHTAIYDSLLRKERPKVKKVGEKLPKNQSDLTSRPGIQDYQGIKGKHGNTVQVNQVTDKKK
eukprot:jgi/Picsp_1/5991/NSC_03346-R1_---NA---